LWIFPLMMQNFCTSITRFFPFFFLSHPSWLSRVPSPYTPGI
jgi:hypothetical protein